MNIFMFIPLTGFLIQKKSMLLFQYFQVLAQEHKHKKRAETALFTSSYIGFSEPKVLSFSMYDLNA